MNKLKNKKGELIVSLVELVIGILLLIKPVGFTSGIIVIIGLLLAAQGIRSIVKYFKMKPAEASKEQLLSKGLIGTMVGLFCVFRSQWFIATFPVLTMLYGVMILLLGMSKIQKMADMLRLKEKYWYLAGIAAALSIIFAIIILANPFASTAALWIFVAISVIAEAILDFCTAFVTA